SGAWGQVLIGRRPVVTNEVHRVWPGRAPLRCSIGVPLLQQGQLVGAVHLADRTGEGGYGEGDIEKLLKIALVIAPIIAAQREIEGRQRAEARLVTARNEAPPAPRSPPRAREEAPERGLECSVLLAED